jgi:hypothetical protein
MRSDTRIWRSTGSFPSFGATGLAFDDHGSTALTGILGEWRLFVVRA